jgi:hypothetical protein
VALVIAIALALLLYKITHVPVVQSAWDDEDEEEEDEEDEAEPESYEPPIVPWRRSRPTPGELPSNRSQTTGSKPSGSSKTRK